ncbi:DUF2147 domain-containing protein [Pseudaestuariivita atlantica]|uniref:DUF2147 domain-containing protein n=1 Tax=Pseudaestuariivita atlantica TaxID=1317121 RepID=UPI0013F4A603|nr:DUF2147 domain-containing protein [Pseudaestuariivita atlantica]
MTRILKVLTSVAVIGFVAGVASAQDARGLWLTQADKKDQVAQVESVPCGAALCGTIVKVFDGSGTQISHPNVGKRVFWDMQPIGNGKYEGMAFVPAHNKNYRATMQVMGSEMLVKGCLGPVCQSQLWQRVQ